MFASRTSAGALRTGLGIFVLMTLPNCAATDEPMDDPSELVQDLTPVWTLCVSSGLHCAFTGTRQVRYGYGSTWTVKTFTDGVHCTGASFGVRSRSWYRCEYDAANPAGTPDPMPMPMANMPYVDESAIPTGSPGTSAVFVRPTTELPAVSGDGTGAFRTSCRFSHMNFDDPIVFPGKERASHLHAFFGNTKTDAFSTQSSIATSGNSTCRGGIVNRTAYWVPAVLDAKGKPIAPEESSFYYKSGYAGIAPGAIKPFPQGLRMIAGDPKAQAAQERALWGCHETYIGWSGEIPTTCGAGNHIVMAVTFPQCWNGRDLDSTDHRSHMAYPVSGACPSTHPVALPEISFHILYTVPAGGNVNWRLSSDMYDPSKPGGYSAHGDWFNGWDPNASDAFVKNCTSQPKDCHSHLLGDGREIYYDGL